MKITKYEHACVVLENNNQKVVIDPGSWTTSLFDLSNVVAIVVTHIHMDHYNPEKLAAIATANPGVQIFSTQEVAESLATPQITTVSEGDTATVGNFTLQFFGKQHALIHPSKPQNQNIGVLVNGSVYYGGDSFTIPAGQPIAVLATPVSAPWLKMAEVIDYYNAIQPQIAFPTHNALLSDIGQKIADTFMQDLADAHGAQYRSLKPGESLEI